jgi:hypothetical protein
MRKTMLSGVALAALLVFTWQFLPQVAEAG